jgi:Common central domain of tyrosinase
MKAEEKLVRDYFGGEGSDPMHSPRMMEHMDWHEREENKNKWGNYGERFLLFHKQYIERFDAFRISKRVLPVTSWDPSTPIPDSLSHETKLEALRDTNYPYSVDTKCKTPTWLTMTGGSERDPKYGYTALYQFRSIDELGFAIDAGWHGKVHNTIGGDMKGFHSPIDPIFWPWHRWIDEIRVTWWTWKISHAVIGRNLGPLLDLIGRLFSGLRRSGDTAMLDEKTIIEPDFTSLLYDSRSTIDALLGIIINQISYQLSDAKSSESLQQVAIKLLNSASEQISTQSSKTDTQSQHRQLTRKKKHAG